MDFTHWVPLQHPVQLFVGQVPPHPSEAPAHLPAQSLGQEEHAWPLQVPPIREQLTHEAPFAPQLALELPARHWRPLQHPAQELVGQVPPHPSESPAHLPAQLFGQELQLPLVQVPPL